MRLVVLKSIQSKICIPILFALHWMFGIESVEIYHKNFFYPWSFSIELNYPSIHRVFQTNLKGLFTCFEIGYGINQNKIRSLICKYIFVSSTVPFKVRIFDNGLNCYRYSENGINCYWKNKNGINCHWYHKNGINCYQYSENGINCYRYNTNGINCYLFNENGINCYRV